MVGSAIVRALLRHGHPTENIITRAREELDLTNQEAVSRFFSKEHIDQVYLAAARVGGIHANNTYPAEFIYSNLAIQINVIHAAHENNVNKLLFLGSSCIYPREATQPMTEDVLLTGPLEPTNEPYAISKIAGIKMCESYRRQYNRDYRSVMPTNLYGPGDNYDRTNSHVIPALIRRFHEAKKENAEKVIIWGTGTPKREFLFVDDLANACVHVMQIKEKEYIAATQPQLGHLNVGSEDELTIANLAAIIATKVGFKGEIEFDAAKPDGAPRKLMSSKKMQELGWKPRTSLETGLAETYSDFINNGNRA
jgi:GDP-L-fucose synthase